MRGGGVAAPGKEGGGCGGNGGWKGICGGGGIRGPGEVGGGMLRPPTPPRGPKKPPASGGGIGGPPPPIGEGGAGTGTGTGTGMGTGTTDDAAPAGRKRCCSSANCWVNLAAPPASTSEEGREALMPPPLSMEPSSAVVGAVLLASRALTRCTVVAPTQYRPVVPSACEVGAKLRTCRSVSSLNGSPNGSRPTLRSSQCTCIATIECALSLPVPPLLEERRTKLRLGS